MQRFWIVIAALLGMTGVGVAAYAAHGLGFIADEQTRELARTTLQQTMLMQMLHALALLGVGLWARQDAAAGRRASLWLHLAGGLQLLGVLVFCGLIYLRILGGVDSLRQFVPWGGTSLMLGWLLLGIAGLGATPARR